MKIIIAPFYYLILVTLFLLTSVTFVTAGIGLISLLVNGVFYRSYNSKDLRVLLTGVLMPLEIVTKFIKK